MRPVVERKWPKLVAAVLAALTLGLSAAHAQATYPTKTVRVVVPYAAGGGADVIARLISQKLSEQMGQQFLVDNRPGASGMIGTKIVAGEPADGYTLLLVGPNHTTNPFLYRNVAFDAVKDFQPIALLTSAPYILVTNPTLGIKNLQDMIALAKSKPGELTYGSAGKGTAGHLAMELIKSSAGIDILHVAYNGSPPVLTDLMGGRIAMAFDNVLSSAPLIADGKLQAIATSGAKRSPSFRDVPTVAESGLPGFDVTVWQGLLAPAGTSKEIVDKLNTAVQAILQEPDVQAKLKSLGVEVAGGTSEEFAAFIDRDMKKWKSVISEADIKLD